MLPPTERIDPVLESTCAVGVDEMSWDDLNSKHYDWPSGMMRCVGERQARAHARYGHAAQPNRVLRWVERQCDVWASYKRA